MLTSLASRRRLRPLAAVASLVASGMLLAACVGPEPAAASALHDWLSDVQAHSVAYAYTLLTASAEQRTAYDPFFNTIMDTTARYAVVSHKVISSTEVNFVVAVKVAGRPTRDVEVQMLEQGNAGDWLVGAPFSTRGASAARDFS